MCLLISAGVFAEVVSRAMEPIPSETPKIRSASVSIRGRGRLFPPGCRNPSSPLEGGIAISHLSVKEEEDIIF
jgi:hypothetical protein